MKRALKFLGLAALCGLGLNALATTAAKIGATEYPTIQAAVDAANASEGVVTINVMAGTHAETVNLQKDNLKFEEDGKIWYGRVNLVGEEGAVISGQITTGAGGDFNVADVTLDGLTFIGSAYPVYIDNNAGNTKNITIRNNTFNYQGAGPYVMGGANDGLTVTGNKFNSTVGLNATLGGNTCTLKNVTVTGNTFANCFGLYGQVLEDGAIVSGNTFTGSCDEGLWINNTKGACVGKIVFSGNGNAGAYKYAIGFATTYGKKSDIVIGEGNTFGGESDTIAGWADSANDKVIVNANAAAGEALYYDHLLYLGDETAFKTPAAAVAGRTEPVTILNYDPSMQPPKDWKFVTEGGVTKLVKKVYVAKIGDEGYETLQEALDAAVDNDLIVLVADATESHLRYNNAINPNPKAHIAINLNEKTLKLDSFYASYATAEGTYAVISNGCIDITDAQCGPPNGEQWPKSVFFAQGNNSLTFDTVHFIGSPKAENNAVFNLNTSGDNTECVFKGCDFALGSSIYIFAEGHYGRYVFKDETTVDLTETAVTGGIFRDDTQGNNLLNVVFDNSVLKVKGAAYSFLYSHLTLDNGARVELKDVKNNGMNCGDLVLSNGSKFLLDGCEVHGFTNGKLVVNEGCEVDVRNAGAIGVNCFAGSLFAKDSKVSVSNSCCTYSTYLDKHIDLRVDTSRDLVIEEGADVDIANEVRLMAGATIRIADGRYGAVLPNAEGVVCTGDLTGGIYKDEPKAEYVNSDYRAVANTDEATMADYPWMIDAKPVAMIGDKEFKTYADALEAAKSDETKIVDLRHADTEGKSLEVYEEQATGNVYLWGSEGANRVFWLTGVSQGSDSNGSDATFSGSRAAGNATLAGVMRDVVAGDVICLPAGCYYVGSVVAISKSCTLTGWLGGEGTTLHKSSGHSQSNQHLLNCSFRDAADLAEAGTVDLVGLNLTTTKDHICVEKNGSNIACWRCAAVQAIGHVTVNVYDVEIRNFPMAAFSVNAANSINNSYAITGKNAMLNWHGLRTYDNFCTASIFALPRSDQKDVAAAAVTQAIFNYDENCTFADADPAHPFHLEDPPKRVPGFGNCIVNGYSLLEYQDGTDGTVTGGFYAADPTESGKLAPCYVANYKENYEFGGFVQNGWLVEQDTDACQAKIVHEDGSVTYYATFADAVKGATSGGTVSANRGIAATEEVIIENKEVTLDLAGQVIEAPIFFTGTAEDFIIDSVGGGKVLGTITVEPGCTLKIRAGTYAFDPSKEPTKWLDPAVDETGRALYVVIVEKDALGNDFYKVMPNQIEVKEPDPKDVAMTDENGNQIPSSEVAEAAAAIVEANTEIKNTIQQNSSIDTGIENAAKESVTTPSGEIVPGPAKSGVVKALQGEAPEAAKGQITSESDISSRLVIDIKQEVATIRTVTVGEEQKKDAVFTTILYKVEPIVKTVVTVTDGAGVETTEEVEATLPNEELKKNPLTFRLGIKDPAATGAYVRHIGHDEFEDETIFCTVKGPAGGRYVELTVDHFSDFEVRTVDAVVVDTDDAVGIVNLGVPGAGMELAAAVPFLKSGVSESATAPKATLADLVVTGRADGDKVVFQNENAEATLSGEVWSGDAAKTPGTAFWYKSANGSGDVPLTLAGLVTDPVETEVAEGTSEAPKATLLVNPYVAAQDVFAAVGDAARDGDQVALVGGDVRYVRENGAWGYWKKSEYRAKEEVAQGGLFMSNEFVRVSSLSVPGGRGVWYVSKGGHPTVAWNAGVPAVTAGQIADAELPTWGSLAWDVSLTAADMDAFAPEKVSLVAYDADGGKVGDYARPLVVDELGQHWTAFLGLDGYDWTDKDVTEAQFAVELLDAAGNVLASTEKVGYGDLLAEKALDVTYAGDKTPAVATDLHAFAGFSVSDNGEFASLTNAFAGFAKVRKTAGGYEVTLTNDMEGVVTIADNLGAVTLDLNGHSITGTNGVNCAGGVALAVTDHIVPGSELTQLLVKDRTGNGGKIVGGKGDRGADGYAGGAAIVIAGGVTVELATGDKLPLVKGGNGGTGYVNAGGAAGYAVATASGEKVTVDGTDDTALPGEFWEAWAWCVCDAPAAEIPGTYHDGTTLWIHRRDGNMRTGAAEFDFAELKNLNVIGGAIHFLPGDFGVKCLTVGTDASDSLAFLGADTGTTLYESSHFSVFDVKRGEGQSACWTNITFTSVGIDDLYGLGGGAIRQEGGSLVVSQCVFSNLVANVGGAIYAEFLAKDSLIADSVFADNEAINYGSEGGAVFAAAKAGTDVTLAFEKCSFTGNRAGNGGAVSVASDFEGDGPITLAVADSRFEGNAADFAGGAIFGNPKALLVDAAATKDDPGETAFLGNSAELSGGAICLNGDLYDDRPAVTMRRGVRFVGNIASNALDFADGGAFACGLRGGCEFAAEGVEFTGNLAFGKYEAFGGALSFYTNCAVTVDTCVFDDNDAVCPLETLYLNYGGAIESEHGAASIRNSTFRNSNIEAVALVCGTAAITNCVAVGNGETVGDYKYDDLYFDACAADVSYSAWGTVFFYEGDSVTGVFNLTNRTTEIYAGDDTLRLNPVGLNPVAALGVKQEAYDFVGVKYGSKAYGSSMGAYETPTERLYVNLNGDKTYDGTTASNDVTWTWTYTTESGAPAAWDDFVTADKFDTVFTLTNWVYGCKDHGYYATTNAAPRDLDAQIKGNDDLAQWYLDSGILEFVGTGAIARRPVEMGGLEFTIDPDEYGWNDGNPVDATVTVVEKIGNLAPLTLVEGTDYHLTCSENTDYTKKAVATADLLHNWIGSTNDTYYITAYLVEYLYDDVVDASLTETYGKTSGVAVAVSVIANPRTGYAFDLYNSPTNGTVRKFDEGDGILRLKVCYYTDVAPADGIPDIYQRKVLAKVVNGSWNTGYKDDATLYATLWDDAGKWSRTGSGAISSGAIPVGGNNAFGQFSAGGWLALTSGGLVEVPNPATFEFDSSTVPFLIYAYRHGTEAGGSGRGGSGRGGSSGRPGSGTAPAQTSLLEQYSAVLSIRDVSFAVDGVTLQTKAVVSGNGADIDVPMEGTTLKVFATESLGKPWNEVKATADGEGRVTIPGNGAASCFFKVGL